MKISLLLSNLFPNYKIEREYYFTYRGRRFYFDFFIPELSVAIECHGKLHFEFNEHFYEGPDDFIRAKRRDRMKEEYAALEGIAFVTVRHDEKIDERILLGKITEAQEEVQ